MKMLFFTGHDDSAFGLYTALGQPIPSQWTYFGIHFEFELWEKKTTGQTLVRSALSHTRTACIRGRGEEEDPLDKCSTMLFHKPSPRLQVRVLLDGKVLSIDGRSVLSLDAFEAYLKPYIVSQQKHQDICWPGTKA